jgi:leucyl aminopeptidase (aminopeptidase T)
MANTSLPEQAATTVLKRCLDLPPGAEIVIFNDETTWNVARLLGEIAVSLSLKPLIVSYSKRMQVNLKDSIPAERLTYMSEADAVLICLNGSPECFAFRDHLRKSAWEAGRKVAHMPGISLAALRMADVNYDLLSERCETLALALAKGRQLVIRTRDLSGGVHELCARLDPWGRLPIISDGIIQKGSWGNVPSGETYIAPPEGLAEGSIVINGSIPKYCFGPDEELILNFEGGRLVDWSPRHSPAEQHLRASFFDLARAQNDSDFVNLAEIGLGVNPKVKRLTGNPLLDEKIYGTLHIALGDNTDMGGEVSSSIHCDMVTRTPEVLIDGKLIIHRGQIVVDPQDWREDTSRLTPPSEWRNDIVLQCTAINTENDRHGRLKRLWHTGSGRICSVPVGDDHSSAQASRVYQWLKKNGKPAYLHEISNHRPFNPSELLQITYLLHLYGLVTTIPSLDNPREFL